jgi:hypothetical protein
MDEIPRGQHSEGTVKGKGVKYSERDRGQGRVWDRVRVKEKR